MIKHKSIDYGSTKSKLLKQYEVKIILLVHWRLFSQKPLDKIALTSKERIVEAVGELLPMGHTKALSLTSEYLFQCLGIGWDGILA